MEGRARPPIFPGQSKNLEAGDSAHTSATWTLNKMPPAPWALMSPVARGTQSCCCPRRGHGPDGWEEGGASLPMTSPDPAPCPGLGGSPHGGRLFQIRALLVRRSWNLTSFLRNYTLLYFQNLSPRGSLISRIWI